MILWASPLLQWFVSLDIPVLLPWVYIIYLKGLPCQDLKRNKDWLIDQMILTVRRSPRVIAIKISKENTEVKMIDQGINKDF